METAAKAASTTLAAAALHFPLRDALVSSVLIGTAKPSSLQRNIEVFDTTIADGVWAELDSHAIRVAG